jgi:hypothetical protein
MIQKTFFLKKGKKNEKCEKNDCSGDSVQGDRTDGMDELAEARSFINSAIRPGSSSVCTSSFSTYTSRDAR